MADPERTFNDREISVIWAMILARENTPQPDSILRGTEDLLETVDDCWEHVKAAFGVSADPKKVVQVSRECLVQLGARVVSLLCLIDEVGEAAHVL